MPGSRVPEGFHGKPPATLPRLRATGCTHLPPTVAARSLCRLQPFHLLPRSRGYRMHTSRSGVYPLRLLARPRRFLSPFSSPRPPSRGLERPELRRREVPDQVRDDELGGGTTKKGAERPREHAIRGRRRCVNPVGPRLSPSGEAGALSGRSYVAGRSRIGVRDDEMGSGATKWGAGAPKRARNSRPPEMCESGRPPPVPERGSRGLERPELRCREVPDRGPGRRNGVRGDEMGGRSDEMGGGGAREPDLDTACCHAPDAAQNCCTKESSPRFRS